MQSSNQGKKVALGMSGGVDSSVAAAQAYEDEHRRDLETDARALASLINATKRAALGAREPSWHAAVTTELRALGEPPWGVNLTADRRFVLPTCDLAARALLTALIEPEDGVS